MDQDPTQVSHPIIKGASSLLVGFGTPIVMTLDNLTKFATFLSISLAAIYSLLLIIEWWWKHALRPFAESRGWISKSRRRRRVVEEWDATTDQMPLLTRDGKEPPK